MHDLPLITTIAAAFTAALLLGLLTQRLGLSPIVGYLLAGVLIGPHTPGFVGDVDIAHQLAEVGVILLMFGVGLHFHLKDLLAVKAVAIPGAIGQMPGRDAPRHRRVRGPRPAGQVGGRARHGDGRGEHRRPHAGVDGRRRAEYAPGPRRGRVGAGPGRLHRHRPRADPRARDRCVRRRRCDRAGALGIPGARAAEARGPGRDRDARRVAGHPVGPRAGRPAAFARAVHAHGAGVLDRAGGRLVRRLRRVDGPRGVPGGHDGGAVAGQSPGRGRCPADARRLRRAVLRVGGHALRPGIRRPRAADDPGGAGHHPDRHAAGRAAHRRPARPFGAHRVDRRPGPGADRRVLVHPVGTGPETRPDARRGAQRAGRRGDPLDHAEPDPVPLIEPDRGLAAPPSAVVVAAQRPRGAASARDQCGRGGAGRPGRRGGGAPRRGRRVRPGGPLGAPPAPRRGARDGRDRDEHGHGLRAETAGPGRDLRGRLPRGDPGASGRAPRLAPGGGLAPLGGSRPRGRRGAEPETRAPHPGAGALPARARGAGAGRRHGRGVRGGGSRHRPGAPGPGRHRRGPRVRGEEGARPPAPAHPRERVQSPLAARAERDGPVDAGPSPVQVGQSRGGRQAGREAAFLALARGRTGNRPAGRLSPGQGPDRRGLRPTRTGRGWCARSARCGPTTISSRR